MTATVFRQSYMTHRPSLIILISYCAIVFSFALMFANGWLTACDGFYDASACWLSHMKQQTIDIDIGSLASCPVGCGSWPGRTKTLKIGTCFSLAKALGIMTAIFVGVWSCCLLPSHRNNFVEVRAVEKWAISSTP